MTTPVTADDERVRSVETPLGQISIEEFKWNEGEEDEHWAHEQNITPAFDEDAPNGVILAHFLGQYAVAYRLVAEGYELHSQLSDGSLLWVNYEE